MTVENEMEGSKQLDPKVLEKVGGPAWERLRGAFFEIATALLETSPASTSEFTTIYIKFLPSKGKADVFGVVWIKSSKQIVVGLSLPDTVNSPRFVSAPQGTKYRGITKYFVVTESEPVPSELTQWAYSAYQNVSSAQCGTP
jgi:hypothetical protein